MPSDTNNQGETEPLLASQRQLNGPNKSASGQPNPPDQNASSSNPPAEPNTESEAEPSFWQLSLMLSGVYLSAGMAALDGTLVATIVSNISSTFDSGTLFAWLVSAYYIANTASQPIAGKLSDIYGRRTGLIATNVIFCIGNPVCGLATSSGMIIAGRAIAGIGGGGIGPVGTAYISDTIPLRRRGLWHEFTNMALGLGSSLGGPIGGLIQDSLDWQWAFTLQVPVTVIYFAMVLFWHLVLQIG